MMDKKRRDEIGRNFVVMNKPTLRIYISELLEHIDQLEHTLKRIADIVQAGECAEQALDEEGE